MTRRLYDFHGVSISTASEHEPWIAAVDRRLGAFPRGRGNGVSSVRIELVAVGSRGPHAASPPPGPVRAVYESPLGTIGYDDEDDVLFMEIGDRIRLRCDPAVGSTTISVREPNAHDLWLLSRPLVTIPLVECLKRHGLYSVHAAGVLAGDATILIAGSSGSGKSTLAAALALAGYPLLADDMVFLGLDERGRLRVHGFPDELDLAPSTLALFPRLRERATAKQPGWPKHRVSPELVGTHRTDAAEPGIVLLTSVAGAPETTVTAATADEALLAIAPNVLLTQVSSAQAHLDALAELVRRSRCYRVSAGSEMNALVDAIRRIEIG